MLGRGVMGRAKAGKISRARIWSYFAVPTSLCSEGILHLSSLQLASVKLNDWRCSSAEQETKVRVVSLFLWRGCIFFMISFHQTLFIHSPSSCPDSSCPEFPFSFSNFWLWIRPQSWSPVHATVECSGFLLCQFLPVSSIALRFFFVSSPNSFVILYYIHYPCTINLVDSVF